MKCDRRWWNDGRLDREFREHWAACEAEERRGCRRAVTFSWATLNRMTLQKIDEQIRTSVNDTWRKLVEGDPNGQPWPEVLAAWAPQLEPSQRTFFGGLPGEPILLRFEAGSMEAFQRALEASGVPFVKESPNLHGFLYRSGIEIREHSVVPIDEVWAISAGGGVLRMKLPSPRSAEP